MIISRAAVDKFLMRKLDDSSRIKKMSRKTLLGFTRDEGFKFHTKPHLHQLAGMALGIAYDEYMFFLDMGLGKTKLCLDLTVLHHARSLVLVPGSSNVSEWVDEIEIHRPELKVYPCYAGEDGRDEAIVDKQYDVVVMTYAMWLRYTCKNVGGAYKTNKPAIKKLCATFDMAVYDESTQFKSNNSVTFRVLRMMSPMLQYKYALTGTPFGNDPNDLWSQFFVVDGGATLGPTLGLFRASFCDEEDNFWGGCKYNFRDDMTTELNRMLRNRSVRYEITECHDLPKVTPKLIGVPLPEDAETYYRRLVDTIKAQHKDMTVVESVFMRMRQLSSGFLYAREGDDPKALRRAMEFDNPKLEALKQWVVTVPVSCKMVIFYDFNHSGKVLSAALEELEIPFAHLGKGSSERGPKKNTVRRFKLEPECRIMLSSMGGAKGLNLQVANYMGFYESPVSTILRQQAERRINRPGQKKPMFMTDFVTRGTLDTKILLHHQTGRDLLELVLEDEE